jgi:hypothetical protein
MAPLDNLIATMFKYRFMFGCRSRRRILKYERLPENMLNCKYLYLYFRAVQNISSRVKLEDTKGQPEATNQSTDKTMAK